MFMNCMLSTKRFTYSQRADGNWNIDYWRSPVEWASCSAKYDCKGFTTVAQAIEYYE